MCPCHCMPCVLVATQPLAPPMYLSTTILKIYPTVFIGLPSVYGLDDQPCYDRSYALVCEHQYSGWVVWLVGEDPEPISQSSSLYTVSSTTLEIHNTSKAVSEDSEVYHCRVDLPTGTTVRGSGYILSPLSMCVQSVLCICYSHAIKITQSKVQYP